MRFLKLLAVFLAASSLLLSQNASLDIKILKVNVEGNTVTSSKIITYTAGINENETIKATTFSKSVKRLWDLGLFSNVQIRLDEETAEGVSITIVVEESPVLGKAVYKGNKQFKAKKINEEISLRPGQRLLPNTLPQIVKELEKLYEDEGFLQTEIKYELVEPSEKDKKDNKTASITKNVLFTIKENKKVKIRNVVFDGNNAFSDFRLRRVLKETKQQRWYLFWRTHFVDKKFDEDKDLLRTFYRNKGYRDFRIESDTISYPSKKRMDIVLKLKEGP